MSARLLIPSAIFGSLMGCMVWAQAAPDLKELSRIETRARDTCQTKIDHDTLELKSCLQELAQQALTSENRQLSQLGIWYYGWLASTVALKNSIPASESTAKYFLLRFRPLQTQLRISDLDLCHTIPGDCVSRIARMKMMEQEMR